MSVWAHQTSSNILTRITKFRRPLPAPLLLWPLIGPSVPAWMTDLCGAIGGINDWQGKQKYSKKTYPSAVLSPQILNPAHRGGKPTAWDTARSKCESVTTTTTM
jgi:hypothetical protein